MRINDIHFIVNHVFLPPKLPQQADESMAEKNLELLDFVCEALESYRRKNFKSQKPFTWTKVFAAVRASLSLSSYGDTSDDTGDDTSDENSFKQTVRSSMENICSGQQDTIALHIGAQNTGLIIQKPATTTMGDNIIFGMFEASPTASAVMGTKGRLCCLFPGPAIAVSIEKVRDSRFLDEFVSFLDQLQSEAIEEAIPESIKAGCVVSETRDTINPKPFIELLTGLLRGIGAPADIRRIQKRIADDVLWNKSRLPWRRSALWLVIRVTLQTTLQNSADTTQDINHYKSFMVFFVAHLIETSLDCSISSDLLFVMNAKLARRVYKANSSLPNFVAEKASKVSQLVRNILEKRWSDIQHVHVQLPTYDQQSLRTAMQLSLENTRHCLSQALKTRARPSKQQLAISKHQKRIYVPSFESNPSRHSVIPTIDITRTHSSMPLVEERLQLADFEAWVYECLDSWRASHHSSTKVKELSDQIIQYTTIAMADYKSHPELMSDMILTAMELWIALDEMAVSQCSLLADYFPEFPATLLEPLLLPRHHQRSRALKVDTYLRRRRADAQFLRESLFAPPANENAFAVRYYESSKSLKNLNRRILEAAEQKKDAKKAEFTQKLRQHEKMLHEASSMECSTAFFRGEFRHRGIKRCAKCKLKRRANRISIDLQEWPLPEEECAAKAVVFELSPPEIFIAWREATYHILVDICTPSNAAGNSKAQMHGELREYPELSPFFKGPQRRLVLATTTKSFLSSHYSSVCFPTSIGHVCVSHAATWKSYDSRSKHWTKDYIGRCNIRELCTLKIPAGPYSGLQYAVDSYQHTSNQVLSNQSDCSTELSIHEYVSFGTLRAGHRLQWLNIARELRARILTLNHEAVQCLILQAAWQAGPAKEISLFRESHEDLADPSFRECLLAELDYTWTTIEENWKECITARTLIDLAACILPVCDEQKGLQHLLRVRSITLQWARGLYQKLQKQNDDDRDLCYKAIQMAVICRQTFDIDDNLVHRWGGGANSDDEIATLIECAIIIKANMASGDTSDSLLDGLLRRDQRLSHKLEAALRKQITINRRARGIDEGITRMFPGHKPGGQWESFSNPNERWLTSTTFNGDDTKQTVHYNLLDGELLINKSRIQRLPSEYTSHPTYCKLFGQKVFKVYQSEKSDSRFQTMSELFGYRFYFSMENCSELVVRAQAIGETTVTHEFIPQEHFEGDFPEIFVKNYRHWRDVTNGTIEFRPETDPWKISPKNWRLACPLSKTTPSFLYSGREQLLDMKNPITLRLTSIFRRLENIEFIHAIVNQDSGGIKVFLPRLDLEFFINEDGVMQSQKLRDMVIDTEQSIGTLTGLQSMLVLRQRSKLPGPIKRNIVVPEGEVIYKKSRDHCSVEITNSQSSQINFHIYEIDTDLGRLVGRGDLKSRLYQIYLHMVTSHCLVDPLTGRTGTEEALRLLRSAATWSFQTGLSSDETRILTLIAALTPVRVFYPPHVQTMQQTFWNSLSPLSQHEDFGELASSILNYADRIHSFTSTSTRSKTHKPKGDSFLLQRAALRNSIFRTEEFGGGYITTSEDSIHEARDIVEGPRETRVCTMARKVELWPSSINVQLNLMSEFEKWDEISGPETDLVVLGYSRQWLAPTLPHNWWSLYEACLRSDRSRNLYMLMFFLCTLTYSEKMDQCLINTLLAVAVGGKERMEPGPTERMYTLSDGYKPDEEILRKSAYDCAIPYEEWDESQVPRTSDAFSSESKKSEHEFISSLKTQVEGVIQEFMGHWPKKDFIPSSTNYPLLRWNAVVEKLNALLNNWLRNKYFVERVEAIQAKLSQVHANQDIFTATQYCLARPTIQSSSFSPVSLLSILPKHVPALPDSLNPFAGIPDSASAKFSFSANNKLNTLLSEFLKENPRGFENRYAIDTLESLSALQSQPNIASSSPAVPLGFFPYVPHWKQWQDYVGKFFNVLCHNLSPQKNPRTEILRTAGCWPRLTPISLLGLLSWSKVGHINLDWKRAIVQYGIAITMLQRARRLVDCSKAIKDSVDLEREYKNPGHRGWDPMEYPDWLLIEIEGNFLVRTVQTSIASQMLAPDSGSNTLLQLNMGEGKSSVIIPIVAAALADGKKIVRVMTLKPLSTQMFHFLVQRLGGLVDRRICHLPFKRHKLDNARVSDMQEFHNDCMHNRTVLLTHPEHIMSFKLSGPEHLLSGSNMQAGKAIVGFQHWLNSNSRDILDESDEVLNVRNELIYTIGTPSPIEYHPYRWTIVQQTLELVSRHILGNKSEKFDMVEIDSAINGSFPKLRILDEGVAGAKIFTNVAFDICNGQLSALPISLFPEDMRHLAFKFITDRDISPEEMHPLLEFCSSRKTCNVPTTALFLLRGLFSEKILQFALTKRWRVDYGLVSRTLLAVPYRAKDIPSERADFSQPDIAIVLTCLSYYYGGLKLHQLETCFEQMQRLDDPEAEYDSWTSGKADIPETSRRLSGLNLDDAECKIDKIFPLFSHNKPTIDFYLSNIVFPKHAQEFPHKLAASGWDLAEAKQHPTTGFSGTNDNRYLLPLSINQHNNNSTKQKHTNAKVLSYLLQPENNYYVYAARPSDERLDTIELLEVIMRQEPPVQVLLDVGAQILDKSNEELAQSWLNLVSEDQARAAVFLDSRDEIMVLDRNQRVQPLVNSHFSSQMDRCLVYLDDVHTRGIDLKLPHSARAAVTLGPMLTKDRLVQACMRLRRLGQGQSVIFISPPECHRKILKDAKKGIDGKVRAVDILRWVMITTCKRTRKNAPMWASQGIDYLERCGPWQAFQNHHSDHSKIAYGLCKPERKTLKEHYLSATKGLELPLADKVPYINEELRDKHREIQGRSDEFGASMNSLVYAMGEEEKEREIFHEMELEKETFDLPKQKPLEHNLSAGLKDCIHKNSPSTGVTLGFIPAFDSVQRGSLQNTSIPAIKNAGASFWTAGKLLVTTDFVQTVADRDEGSMDHFLRPVNWVLSRNYPSQPALIAISPYEANELIPEIRKSKMVTLHVYAPKVTRSMRSLEDLAFFSVSGSSRSTPSPHAVAQLNAFSGQLYFKDLNTYHMLCHNLGIKTWSAISDSGSWTEEGILGDGSSTRQNKHSSSKSPVEILSELIRCRRKGQCYLATHVGRVLSGKQLSERDFENI